MLHILKINTFNVLKMNVEGKTLKKNKIIFSLNRMNKIPLLILHQESYHYFYFRCIILKNFLPSFCAGSIIETVKHFVRINYSLEDFNFQKTH